MIAAVVLAAGQSQRMGQPKMALPWGQTTVIGHVVHTLLSGGVDEVVVVTGGGRDQVEAALSELPPGLPLRTVFNPDYARAEMARSLAVGLEALPAGALAALVALGDQPQIEAQTVQAVIASYQSEPAALIIPSYQMRRGHPWLIERVLWPAVLALPPGATLRHLLNASADQIRYLVVETPSVLLDMDTPLDYEQFKPT